ncbi:MAG: NYN domain-containing protein [Bacteroidetes bacterium]|nr:NYN domain-containing protein [Bacteroidota bacterium]
MIHYIIDGNNLIGKIKSLHVLQNKEKQASREGLVNILNRYFAGKKIKLTLHLDGHINSVLHLSKGRIIYSENESADNKIRDEIDRSKNPKLITLITSDQSLMNYARVNSASVIKSEQFYKEILNSEKGNEESEKVKQLENEKNIFLDMFSKK